MPHEKPRPPEHPSSPSFHTSPAPSTKGAFHTKQRWVRAHAMADQSSQDWRARTGADTQRVAYARALLQVRRGGRTTTSIYCDTNVSKQLYSHHSPCPYPSLLPSDQHPPCPFSQLKTIWLRLPPSIIMGAQRRNPRLARGSAKSVCLRAHRYLHYALSSSHTRPRTLTTPLNATTLHTSLPRDPRPHPCTP